MTDDAPKEHRQDGVGEPDTLDRLWTPHRMAYIKGESKPSDGTAETCPFCRVPTLSDEDGLIVHRGTDCFVVLNLYPYAPGHLMACPYRHVADYTELPHKELRPEQLMSIGQPQRDQIENQVAEQVAVELINRLPRSPQEFEQFINRGYDLAQHMSWDAVARDYVIPGILRAAKAQRLRQIA